MRTWEPACSACSVRRLRSAVTSVPPMLYWGGSRHGRGTSLRPVAPSAYVPYTFGPALSNGLTVRVAADPARITSAVREQIRLSDPPLPVFGVRTMEDLRQFSFWRYKVFGWMFSSFGAAALLLASIGVYGVLAYSVSQRTQEIGVRVALGAGRRDVMGLVVGQGLKLAAIGIGVGVIGALGVTQIIKGLLYNVTPSDPLSFTVVAIFLTVVAVVASYVERWRSIRLSRCGMSKSRCRGWIFNGATADISATIGGRAARSPVPPGFGSRGARAEAAASRSSPPCHRIRARASSSALHPACASGRLAACNRAERRLATGSRAVCAEAPALDHPRA